MWPLCHYERKMMALWVTACRRGGRTKTRMGRSTVHYADSNTNNILKKLHNKLRPAGTPVQRVEYIIELLLLRIFEVKLKRDPEFKELRQLFTGKNEQLLFSSLFSIPNDLLLPTLNGAFFPFYANILSHARQVSQRNLGQKVFDQLVLIDEVFKNSNFTNNVRSGNLQEVLALVGELDEERLLKTDLLGDAIESALSETGGTKDLGLYRTPDHVRQFMVGLVNPTFDDMVHDPACGTGGFLFDSFGYVIEGVSQDGHWPGPKAHPELTAYFEKHFAERPAPMPSNEKALSFYRTGLSGMEYLGMIHKMAAINFYIRGLNPQNIQQGDSLAAFDAVRDAGTKTVILANPPFGAERDQESYPNVWEEFSRESETTTLFVKLMLDTLAPGGRCAVIVSEGFLTWDQASARHLRKMLLEEANLRAVISLPQGVFVSKSGIGPKTSILYFEKGRPTKDVWFYKVTNDGYTVGTNRRAVQGCQLVEALQLFDKYVRLGKKAPETKHSFSVPADWILSLDPRIKHRLEAETTAEFSDKEIGDRASLEAKLAAQVEQGKLTTLEYGERLAQHGELWRAKTQNEIAKRIEKAHLYSFNLPGHRSNMTRAQLEQWHETVRRAKNVKLSSLDDRYAALQKSSSSEALHALSLLDVKNSVEFDIVREFLMNLPTPDVNAQNELAQLKRIIESGAKYPRVRLGDYLRRNTDMVIPSEFPDTRFRVLGVSNSEGVFLNETKTGAEFNQAYCRVRVRELCYNPYRVNVGSIGLNQFDYDNQIISGAYEVFGTEEAELLPEYLIALFGSSQFRTYVNEKAHGGVRMNFKYDALQDWEIPLPEVSVQERIIANVRRQQTLKASATSVLANWTLDARLFEGVELKPLRTVLSDISNGKYKPASDYGEGVQIVRIDDYSHGDMLAGASSLQRVRATESEVAKYELREGDILLNRVNSLEHVGKVAFINNVVEPTIFESNMMRLRIDTSLANPLYVFYALTLQESIGQLRSMSKRAVGQVSVNQQDVQSLLLPLPGLPEQKHILAAIIQENVVLDGLRKMAARADDELSKLMGEVWSEA
jgi:type I restriction-modification system DNA methylase subunit/restriction endonuclease S subunit